MGRVQHSAGSLDEGPAYIWGGGRRPLDGPLEDVLARRMPADLSTRAQKGQNWGGGVLYREKHGMQQEFVCKCW